MTRHPRRSTLFPYTTPSRSQAENEAANKGTDDTQHDVADQPVTAALHELPRKPARDQAHHQPGDEATRIKIHRSEEHTSELQSQSNLVCRLLLETDTQCSMT